MEISALLSEKLLRPAPPIKNAGIAASPHLALSGRFVQLSPAAIVSFSTAVWIEASVPEF